MTHKLSLNVLYHHKQYFTCNERTDYQPILPIEYDADDLYRHHHVGIRDFGFFLNDSSMTDYPKK